MAALLLLQIWARYSQSSRLALGAPRRSRCSPGVSPRAARAVGSVGFGAELRTYPPDPHDLPDLPDPRLTCPASVRARVRRQPDKQHPAAGLNDPHLAVVEKSGLA